MQQLKVRLLEKALGWSLGVAAVGNDNIEFILLVCQELESVSNMYGDIGMLEADAHPGQVFFRQTDDRLVDVANDRCFDR